MNYIVFKTAGTEKYPYSFKIILENNMVRNFMFDTENKADSALTCFLSMKKDIVSLFRNNFERSNNTSYYDFKENPYVIRDLTGLHYKDLKYI